MNAILAAFALGMITAGIGAWKDSVWEPFRTMTFVRSPTIATAWGFALWYTARSSNWFIVALAAIALERFTVETWKAILRKRPSKFQSPERDTRWLLERLLTVLRGIVPRRSQDRYTTHPVGVISGRRSRQGPGMRRTGARVKGGLANGPAVDLLQVD